MVNTHDAELAAAPRCRRAGTETRHRAWWGWPISDPWRMWAVFGLPTAGAYLLGWAYPEILHRSLPWVAGYCVLVTVIAWIVLAVRGRRAVGNSGELGDPPLGTWS